jgi:hypothetical protein
MSFIPEGTAFLHLTELNAPYLSADCLLKVDILTRPASHFDALPFAQTPGQLSPEVGQPFSPLVITLAPSQSGPARTYRPQASSQPHEPAATHTRAGGASWFWQRSN